MRILKLGVIAFLTLAVGATATAFTFNAVAESQPGAGEARQTTPTTAPANVPDDSVWMENEAPEWLPQDELIGEYSGYCKDGQPVITKRPVRAETPTESIKLICWGDTLVNDIISTAPITGKRAEDKLLIAPPDFSRLVEINLNGYSVVNPRDEFAVFPYVTAAGRTLLPVRWLAEAAGARIRWNPQTQTIEIHWDNKLVWMQIGNPKATVNGKEVTLEQPPTLIAGRTMVPVRFAVESMGGTVNWDDSTATVSVKLDGATCPPSYCYEKREEVQKAYNDAYAASHPAGN